MVSKSVLVCSALALALLVPPAAQAATDADLAEIREQIRQLKESYETRIQALEQRLKDAEAKNARGSRSATRRRSPARDRLRRRRSRQRRRSGISAFNPAISAVLQGTYGNFSQDPNKYALSGFAPSGDIAPGKRGFNLGESELAISANVDDKFFGNLIVSLTPENTLSVEEAYGLYTGAGYGLAPKFGRFFSSLGYLNDQHQHVWDFVDAPLVYQAFLGGQYDVDGLQLKWLAPTDQFLEFGGELGNGEGFPGTSRNKNGIGSGIVYVHTGGDIDASNSWRAGLSYLQTRAQDRDYAQTDLMGNDAQVGFSGSSRLAVADFVWKYAPNGNSQQTNFKLQGEYFWRRESGDFTYDRDNALGLDEHVELRRAAKRLLRAGRLSVHADVAESARATTGSIRARSTTVRTRLYLENPSFHPERSTAMIDWTPSEFSRVRLQFAQARLRPGITDNEFFVQYILTLGAHGAHKY